ncbi:MAG: hypothetical protein AB7T86_07170 [Xanthobacteraceae bacterium]|jgi:hypothetical protein|uniref:hypothetical protein n=1 Tax=Pseudolabrys sp. TaxID=1960880 RepID=UPI003D0B8D19
MNAMAALFGRKTAVRLAVGAGLALIAAANWHLVYVATASQPGCVPHLRQSDGGADSFRAAVSSCTVK